MATTLRIIASATSVLGVVVSMCLGSLCHARSQPVGPQEIDRVFLVSSASEGTGVAKQAVGVLVRGLGVITPDHGVAGASVLSVRSMGGRPYSIAALKALGSDDLVAMQLPSIRDNEGFAPSDRTFVLGDTLSAYVYRPVEQRGEASVVQTRIADVYLIMGIGEVLVADMESVPGDSGSPVLDQDGQLVGVIGGRIEVERTYIIRVLPERYGDSQWRPVGEALDESKGPVRRAREMWSEAGRFEEEGLHASAMKRLDRALEIVPTFVPALVLAGDIAFGQGHFDEAADYYEKATHELPRLSVAWLRLGRCRDHAGRVRAAIDAYRKCVALAPGNTEASYRLGVGLIAAGCVDRGAELLGTVAKDSEYWERLGRIGADLLERSQETAAWIVCEGLVESGAPVGTRLGVRLHLRQGRREDAVEMLVRGLEGAGIADGREVARAIVMLEEGQSEEAIEQSRRIRSMDKPNALALCALGQALQANGELDEAERVLESAVARDPGVFDGWLWLSSVRLEQGSGDEALASLEHALVLRPEHPWVAEAACDLFIQKGNREAAEWVARSHADACDRSTRSLVLLADVLVACEAPSEAVGVLREARAKAGDVESVLVGLVRALLASGNAGEADRVQEVLDRVTR